MRETEPLLAPDGRVRGPRRTRRDWVVDTLVVTVVALWALAALVLAASPAGGGVFRGPTRMEVAVDLAVGAVALTSLWWRRRWPVLLGLLAAVVQVVSVVAGGAAFVLLLTVAIHRRWPWAVLVAGTNVVGGAVYYWYWQDGSTGWSGFVVTIVAGTAMIAAAVGFGMFLRARRQLLATLRERAERAEAEQRRAADAARQGERTRIAREMHDVLAHRISLVSMHAGALEFRRDADPDEVAAAAGVIRDNAHRALEDLREVIGVLRDDPTGDEAAGGDRGARPQPTLGDLDALVAQTREAGVPVAVDHDLPDAPLPLTTSRTAYRVLQEGLTNARKHGGGGRVHVSVHGSPGDGLQLTVHNAMRPGRLRPGATAGSAGGGRAGRVGGDGPDRADGPGTRTGAATATVVDPVPGAGVGLVGLAERARLVGGRVEHGETADGFRLAVWLPWPVEGP